MFTREEWNQVEASAFSMLERLQPFVDAVRRGDIRGDAARDIVAQYDDAQLTLRRCEVYTLHA